MPPSTRILLIRHAEKPTADDLGIDRHGSPDARSLTVRGWQRAGALVRFFAPVATGAAPTAVWQPGRLFAAASTVGHPSTRPHDTLIPLSEALTTHIVDFPSDDLPRLVEELVSAPGTTLFSGRRHELPAIAQRLLARSDAVPTTWPEARFDIVWSVEVDGPHRRFTQLPMQLLAGDSNRLIPRKLGGTLRGDSAKATMPLGATTRTSRP